MRACVLGGGLAGALLTWRLTQAAADWRIDLVAGMRTAADATAASGGAVRAFENDPTQRGLAIASLLELIHSRTLREWADFRPVESVYLSADGAAVLQTAATELDRAIPGSAELLTASDLQRRGWAEVSDGQLALLERTAGYVSPHRFRTAVLADAALHPNVSIIDDDVSRISLRDDGTVGCRIGGSDNLYDIAVIAAGSWTPAVLAANHLPADGYRTKSIQYSIYPVAQWSPTEFVDEHAGLFGRPTADGQLLLGVPTDEWDIDPDRPTATPALHERAAKLAAWRFPKLRLGPAVLRVSSADCYCDSQMLTLRPVVPSSNRLFTFTGGSGGSAKTALAASQRASVHLTGSDLGRLPSPSKDQPGSPALHPK